MEQVLVNVYVPILGASYDIFIPLEFSMSEVLGLIKKAVVNLSEGRFLADENTIICRREDGKELNINLSVFELGIRNGSKLMLI